VLSNIDEGNLRSLSECRVADQILDLVPNIEVDSCFLLHYFQYIFFKDGNIM
jgi:poly(A) polymerase Pap1